MSPEIPQDPELETSGRWVISSDSVAEREVGAESPEVPGIDQLPEVLGYVETPELRQLRAAWVEAVKAVSDNARELAMVYQEKAEALDAEYLANFRRGRQLVEAWLERVSEAGTGVSDEAPIGEAAALGFTETQSMREIRARITLLAQKPAELSPDLRAEYLGEYSALANCREAEYGATFQIGLLLAKASVQRDAGMHHNYLDDLRDALEYAYQMGLDDIVESIEQEIYPPRE